MSRLSCGGLTTRVPPFNFNLVATPNEWRKQTVSDARTAGTVSERGERYREFFQDLIDTLRKIINSQV